MLYLDSESIGFTGPTLLWQWAIDDGKIELYDVFTKPVSQTLELLEWFCTQEVCAWNLVFDWFKAVQQFNILYEMGNKLFPPSPGEYYHVEKKNPCSHFLRPKAALDLMVWCCEDRYQKVMERKPVTIKRVPRVLAYKLVDELNSRFDFDPILFARYKKKKPGWEVCELQFPEPDFVNVILRFKPSKSLDNVAKDVLGVGKAPSYFHLLPNLQEFPWRPYGGNWIDYADHFIDFWSRHEEARRYAYRDVQVLRDLHVYFGKPEAGGYNSELCCAVANTRWKGFEIDQEQIAKIIEEANTTFKKAPVNVNSPAQVKRYLKAGLPAMEAAILTSTNAQVLDTLSKREDEAGRRARIIRRSRKAGARSRLFEKLVDCHRFHAANKILGTLSDRMSGAGRFNSQGINKELRCAFTMAKKHVEQLQGGDFDAFEVSIAQAVYNDKRMEEDLKSGKKLHAMMASRILDEDYDKILLTNKGDCGLCKGEGVTQLDDPETIEMVQRFPGVESVVEGSSIECPMCEGDGVVKDLYKVGKQVFFASLYGAQERKLAFITGKSVEEMKKGLDSYQERYPGIGRERMQMALYYEALFQPGGDGPIKWREPRRYVESLLGFRRRFDIEYDTIKLLYELAIDLPKSWRVIKSKVLRREVKGKQYVTNATSSALFGAAFGVQSMVKRQAGNHKIQSTGAGITKRLQIKLWKEYQPIGVHKPIAQILNVHDELQCVTPTDVDMTDTVKEFIEEYRSIVPLLGMKWETNLPFWK